MQTPSRFRVPSRFLLSALLVILGGLGASVSRAAVSLPGVFTDHMVLQQGRPVPVWGRAAEDELVVVQYRDQVKTTRAKGGKWMVRLDAMKAGDSGTVFAVFGENTIELTNVVVGEVWLASGQSNMQWPLQRSDNWTKAAAASSNPNLRLFYVPRVKSPEPLNDLQGEHLGGKPRWQVSGPDSTPEFSAVAYYFGRDLQQALGVPVGIIHTSWGGSPAEVWMRDEVLRDHLEYRRDILDRHAGALARYEAAKARHDQLVATARAEGKPAPKEPAPRLPWRPSELYNAMIHPLIPYAIQGAIWYQGEANAGRAWQYRTLFADMIQNWRRDWGQGHFPFLAVELAPWDFNRKRSLDEITRKPGDSTWGELREAQMLAADRLRNVGTISITDVGDKDDIHPTNKAPVGARLALAARGLAYGESLTWSGPAYRGRSIRNGEVTVQFNHVGGGLVAKDGPLTGFSICGEDQIFVWANARIEGRTVVVSHPNITKPVAVRYGWADYPVVNIFNQEGLPAHPFRTDDFPLTTRPKP